MRPAFDDEQLREAMRDWLEASEDLDDASSRGNEREVLDAADHKSVAGLALRARLTELGWTPPTPAALPEHQDNTAR